MAGRKPDWKVFVSREGQDAQGNDKQFYTEVGAAWLVGDGAISITVHSLPLDGKLVCFKNEPKEK